MDLGFGIFIARMGLGSRAWGLGFGVPVPASMRWPPGWVTGVPVCTWRLITY